VETLAVFFYHTWNGLLSCKESMKWKEQKFKNIQFANFASFHFRHIPPREFTGLSRKWPSFHNDQS
jgi:hypothetical protein